MGMSDLNEGFRNVPFYSQKVNWAGEDSGFPNRDEIDRWQSNCCGIACTRMIIDYFTGRKVNYWDLLQQGLQLKAYNEIGWIHKGLVELASQYGVEGRAIRGKELKHVKDSVNHGMLCIVSVSVGFRGGLFKNGTNDVFGKGGHLVVAFKNGSGELSCNHPSSLDEWNKEDWVVPEDSWKRSFSGNYMEFFV